MIDKNRIEEIVKEFTNGTEIFVVSVKVNNANRISVLADKNDGITIEECASLHRHIENNLSRDDEDYEMQVSSPGLDMPFMVIDQYLKNEGKRVEVTDKEGIKLFGILRNVTSGGFELEAEVKLKGKPRELKEISFNFDQVKSTRVVLTIK